MDEDYTFQPQLNSRSRHLARHAPTLRERQEQEERLRRSASRETPAERPSRSPVAAAARRHTATPLSDTEKRNHDVIESVWALWRAVAAGENREEERLYVKAKDALAAAAPPRPPTVHVATILAMLSSLGIRPPHHAALIEKFLAALGVRGEDAEEDVVEAGRFVHVLTTVWRAAITNRTRWSPAPARVRSAEGVASAAKSVGRPLPRPSASSRREPPARSGTSVEDAVDSSDLDKTVTPRSISNPRASSPSSPSEEAEPTESSSGSYTSHDTVEDSGSDDAVPSENGSFLHTNLSRASPPTTPRSSDAKSAQLSPFSNEDAPGMSLSPEPRDPLNSSSPARTPPHVARPARTPFATTPAPLRASSSSSMRRVRGSSSKTRVLASDSHLLTSTASCERKKSTKRVPGGLMRECTFKPKINDVTSEVRAGSASSCETTNAAGAQLRAEHVDAAPTFQPNTLQYHRERAKLAWWTERPIKESVYVGNGEVQRSPHLEQQSGNAGPVPLAPGFDTAVRRMIAARQRQRQLQLATAPAPRVLRRESAVRKAEAPLLYVDVDLPRGETGRIALFRDADVAAVAKTFAGQHALDERLSRRLEDILRTQLQTFS